MSVFFFHYVFARIIRAFITVFIPFFLPLFAEDDFAFLAAERGLAGIGAVTSGTGVF
jgi:hypothetical protein